MFSSLEFLLVINWFRFPYKCIIQWTNVFIYIDILCWWSLCYKMLWRHIHSHVLKLAVQHFDLATDDFNNTFVIHCDRLRIFFDNFTCFKGHAMLNAFKYSSVNLSRGGGDLFLWIINGTLLFLRNINLSLLFLRKINWRQLWKNNSILLSLWIIKSLFSLRKYRKFMGKMLFNY